MAKLSSVNKNERRKKLVQQYAGKYAALKAIANDTKADDNDRLMARLKMAESSLTAGGGPGSPHPAGVPSWTNQFASACA